MGKKIYVCLLLIIISSGIGFAQEENFELKRIDDALSKNDVETFLELQKELVIFADGADDIEVLIVGYGFAIEKYIDGKYYQEADTLIAVLLEKMKQHYGSKHKKIATVLFILAFNYAKNNQINNAINYAIQSVQMFESINEVKEDSYLSAVMLLTTCYNTTQQYPKGIAVLKKLLSVLGEHNIPETRLVTIYRTLSINYFNLDNFSMSLLYAKKQIELYEKNRDTQTRNYLNMKQQLARLYCMNGDYEVAMHLTNEVCDTTKIKYDNTTYARALCEKAYVYINTNNEYNVKKAIKFAEEAENIYITANDTLSYDYIYALETQADAYRSIALFECCTEINKKIYKILKTLDIDDTDDLENLLYFAISTNNLLEGLSYLNKWKEFAIREGNLNSIEYANIECWTSVLQYALCEYDNAIKSVKTALPIIRNALASSFYLLDEEERTAFWNKFSYLFYDLIPMMCNTQQKSELEIPKLMYDAALLSKGILLNVEILMRKLKEDGFSSSDLEKVLDLNWRNIQTKLKNNDIAIEFIRIPYNKIPTYVAVTIRKDNELPRLIKLFNEDELQQISDTLYYQSPDMFNLVWKPLEQELKGVQNIYFSPAGALYNIGIEYLPNMEEYNLYRLSSTRELVVNSKQEQTDNAVLYGGLDYYAKLDTTKVNDDSFLDDTFAYHADVRGMNLRGGMGALPQTKVEVEQIGEELNKAKWSYQVFTDEKGTEESFKSLSGKKIKSLHISTHGFYYTREDADNLGYDFLQLMGNRSSSEYKALTRSGLIMAGANHILEGEELPDNVEDGILTAKEIADVDLRGLDLVVLSACQTGLGDIAQGEGVFGLQRGFKKAGANSILMSLWEVNDEATQILMTQFYRNLLSGQSKYNSLQSAQKYLREYDNGRYDAPQYWAAFILLDGLL